MTMLGEVFVPTTGELVREFINHMLDQFVRFHSFFGTWDRFYHHVHSYAGGNETLEIAISLLALCISIFPALMAWNFFFSTLISSRDKLPSLARSTLALNFVLGGLSSLFLFANPLQATISIAVICFDLMGSNLYALIKSFFKRREA